MGDETALPGFVYTYTSVPIKSEIYLWFLTVWLEF